VWENGASNAATLQWTTVPGTIFAFLSVVALLSGAIAVIRSQLFKARLDAAEGAVEGLRGDRDDLQHRLDDARKETTECNSRYEILRARLTAEEKKREALETVVTGKKELETVLRILEQHDKRAMQIQTMVKDLVKRSGG
jgi:chromosome segregation ATPase